MIGVLPTYEQIGFAAPALLVVMRLLQGVSAAGEQAGASSMTLEHAPDHRPRLLHQLHAVGRAGGLILATLAVFIPISALPEDQLLAWGWRIPFLLSAVVVAVGFLGAPHLAQGRPLLKKTPRPGQGPSCRWWSCSPSTRPRCCVWCCRAGVGGQHHLQRVHAVVCGQHHPHPRATMLTVLVLASLVALGAIPLWATLSNRIGRRGVHHQIALGSAALISPYMWALSMTIFR